MNRFITVQRAPEPADVWWENARTLSQGGFRRVLSWVAYLVLVAVSCGIQGLLTYLAEQVRQRSVICFVTMLTWHVIPVLFDDRGARVRATRCYAVAGSSDCKGDRSAETLLHALYTMYTGT